MQLADDRKRETDSDAKGWKSFSETLRFMREREAVKTRKIKPEKKTDERKEDAMTFTMEEDGNITVGQTNTEGFGKFESEKDLAEVAQGKDLATIWNSFAGVAPFGELKPVKKFTSRSAGVKRIWAAIQRLAKTNGDSAAKACESDQRRATKKSKVSEAANERAEKSPGPAEFRPGSKRRKAVNLMRRASGASLEELGAALGWTERTVRGFCGRLKRRGARIEAEKDEKRGRVFRIS